MPAAMVIPPTLAYITVVAVRKLIFGISFIGDSSSGQQGESGIRVAWW